jgi:hypothetical protein
MEPPITAKHDLVKSTLNHWIKLIHKGGRSTLYIAMDFHILTLRPSKVVLIQVTESFAVKYWW